MIDMKLYELIVKREGGMGVHLDESPRSGK